MILLEEYKQILDYYSSINADDVIYQNYKNNVGKQFEFIINDKIINSCNKFFLYWQVSFVFKKSINWSLNLGLKNCFTGNSIVLSNTDFLSNIDLGEKIHIDHLLITPYAVFIFEAKNHKNDTTYYSALDKWFIEESKNKIDNPVLQVIKHQSIVSSMMMYHQINLPIISKVVFRQRVNLNNVSEYERNFCITYQDLIQQINQISEIYESKPNEALKFAKALYFYGCHPIAYDDNQQNWR